MRAGDFNSLISIQAASTGPDGNGDSATTWAEIAKVWAKKEDLSGRELFAAEAAQSEITTRFRVRYRDGLLTTMRVVCRGVNYGIFAIVDRKGTMEELHLMCSSGLVDG